MAKLLSTGDTSVAFPLCRSLAAFRKVAKVARRLRTQQTSLAAMARASARPHSRRRQVGGGRLGGSDNLVVITVALEVTEVQDAVELAKHRPLPAWSRVAVFRASRGQRSRAAFFHGSRGNNFRCGFGAAGDMTGKGVMIVEN
jgi:hypothetical protein